MSTTHHEHGSESCRELFARLSEYIDDELETTVRHEMQCHLEDCEPCVAFLESLRRTVRMIEGLESAPLPGAVRDQVLAAYRKLRENRAD